jgi:hypothetical protein
MGYETSSQGTPPVSQPTRQWAEISAATRLGEGGVDAGVDNQLGDARVVEQDGNLQAPIGALRSGLGAENELAFLGEEDAGPDAGAVVDERRDDVAQNVVGVAASGQDPVDRVERSRAQSSRGLRRRESARGRGRAPAAAGVRLVDPDQRLRGGDHQLVVLAVRELVGGVVVRHAGRADPLDAHEDLEQVVESRRGVVLDRRCAHREVTPGMANRLPRSRWRWYSVRARSKYGM